jgi:predicted ATPase
MAGQLLERDTELARLHAVVGAVGRTGGRVVLVRGEAGIGKSALVNRFLNEVAGRAEVHLGV